MYIYIYIYTYIHGLGLRLLLGVGLQEALLGQPGNRACICLFYVIFICYFLFYFFFNYYHCFSLLFLGRPSFARKHEPMGAGGRTVSFHK